MSGELTNADVLQLMRDRSPETRAATAEKLAATFDSTTLGQFERQQAEEILRLMATDAEVRVRAALSESLKQSPNLPPDLAAQLAGDVEAVALPVLEFSKVLSDEDLLAVIAGDSPSKREAIAGRADVSADVCDALVDQGEETVAAKLAGNEGAHLREVTLEKMLEKFSEVEAVTTPMARRRKLPVGVAERLVSVVSEQLRVHLVANHNLRPEFAADLVMHGRERATLEYSGDETAEELVRALNRNGRLTPSIIVRSLCLGDIRFFEWAMSILVRIPIANTRVLIHDRGALGLEALFERSGLPEAAFPVLRTAVDVLRETEYDGAPNDQERFTRRMIERMLTHCESPEDAVDAENIDYLLGRLNGTVPATPDGSGGVASAA